MTNIDLKSQELVPASIVKLIFDQVKTSTDINTESVKSLTLAINELIRIVLNSPTRKEIMEKLENIAEHDLEREKELINTIYKIRDGYDLRIKDSDILMEKCIDEVKDSVENTVSDLSKKEITLSKFSDKLETITININNINTRFDKLINLLKLFTVVISIFISLVGGIYLYVDKDINNNIDRKIEYAIKQIVTSRPSNVPPQPIKR